VVLCLPLLVHAHPGRTASDGCHYCRTNCDRWGEVYGERHCHNGGYGQSTYYAEGTYYSQPRYYSQPAYYAQNTYYDQGAYSVTNLYANDRRDSDEFGLVAAILAGAGALWYALRKLR